MILKITTHLLNTVPDGGMITPNPITTGTISIQNSDGRKVLPSGAGQSTNIGGLPSTAQSGTSFQLKDQAGYNLSCKIWYSSGATFVQIPLLYITSSATLTLTITSAGSTITIPFTVYGYDIAINLYLLSTSITNKTLSTFFSIAAPTSNIKTLYRSSNAPYSTSAYTVGGKVYNGENVSIQVNQDEQASLTSTLVYNVGTTLEVHNHTYILPEDLGVFNIFPKVTVVKKLRNEDINISNKIAYTVSLDYSNTTQLPIDGSNKYISNHSSVEIRTLDANDLEVQLHIMAINDLDPEGLEIVKNIQVDEFDLLTPGKYTIHTTFNIFGEDACAEDVIYYAGDYIVGYTYSNAGLNTGTPCVINSTPVEKGTNITLIPAYKYESQLTPKQYYRQIYPTIDSTIQAYVEVVKPSTYVEGVNNTTLTTYISFDNQQYTQVKPFVSKTIVDAFQVYELFKIEKIAESVHTIFNVGLDDLQLTVYKLHDKQEDIQEIRMLRVNSETDLQLDDGVYRVNISTSSEPNAYSRDVIIISYPTIISGEMKYLSMIMNDCVTKKIDHRVFYDFISFWFMTDIFYKMEANNNNFYYIYSEPISDKRMTELYDTDMILNRVKEYISIYDKKNNI